MSVQPPEVRLLFENSRGDVSRIASYGLLPYSEGLDQAQEHCLLESFGTIQVEVDRGAGKSGIAILVDGKDSKSRSVGNTQLLSVKLDQDLAFHRISVVAPPSHALTLDISVQHHYKPRGFAGASGLPKWTLSRFKSELGKYQTFFDESKQRSVLPDIQNTGLIAGQEDASQLLIQVIGRLELAISTVTNSEASVDFHVRTLGNFDRDAILSALKQNPNHLIPHCAGIINFKDDRYTTAISHRLLRNTSKVDLSEVAAILSACATIVKQSAAPAISSVLLSTLVEEIRFRFPCRERNSPDIGAVLEREMRSPFGTTIQYHLRMLVAIINNLVGRDPIQHGLLWLRQSIQDRDVYQASVFACCAKAFGFFEQDILLSQGFLETTDIVVANANASRGLKLFQDAVGSWRASSIQPSDYRPDTFVLHQGRPVVIDAKFRMPNSTAMVAEPDGLKDVQAYLNDFGLNTAIVVVPVIFNRSAIGPDGYAIIEGGTNRILVVEMQDSDSLQAQQSIKKAVESAALTAHSGSTG